RHAQGRRRLPIADEQLLHRHLARQAIRRAARGIRRGLHLPPLRAGRLRPGNDAIKTATSILDYVFRELAISYLGRNDLAHVNPDSIGFDALGKGEDEGKAPAGSTPSAARIVSKGLVRGKPTNFLSIEGGAG